MDTTGNLLLALHLTGASRSGSIGAARAMASRTLLSAAGLTTAPTAGNFTITGGRGDLLSVVAQLSARGLLLQLALPARLTDVDVVREIYVSRPRFPARLDRILSAAIRKRMIARERQAPSAVVTWPS